MNNDEVLTGINLLRVRSSRSIQTAFVIILLLILPYHVTLVMYVTTFYLCSINFPYRCSSLSEQLTVQNLLSWSPPVSIQLPITRTSSSFAIVMTCLQIADCFFPDASSKFSLQTNFYQKIYTSCLYSHAVMIILL